MSDGAGCRGRPPRPCRRWPGRRGPPSRPGRRPDEPDLERADVGRHVVDHDIGPGLWIELDVADLDQAVRPPELDPALGVLEVEVGDADEHRPRDGRRRGPDRQRDDRLVPVRSTRPRRTLIGASTVPVGGVASDPSVATRIWASPDRAASLPASSSASPRLPLALLGRIVGERLADPPQVGRLVDHDPCRPVGGDHADLAARRQVAQRIQGGGLGGLEPGRGERPWRPCWPTCPAPAPRPGRARPAAPGRAGRRAAPGSRRAAVGAAGAGSGASRCHGALASTSATSRVHSSVEGTTVSSRRSLSRYIARTAGTNSRPSSASGLVNGIGLAQHAPAAQLVEHQVGQVGVGRAGRRSSPGASRRGRRTRPSRPPVGPCRRRASAGRR